MRVLFSTVALPGHFFPLAPLAWAFRIHGHEVLVATAEDFCATVQNAGLPVASCGPVPGFAELAQDPGGLDPAQWRYANGTVFGQLAARSLAGTSSLVSSWGPDLVVSERAEFAGPIAAALHQTPQAEVHWGTAPLAEHRQGAAQVLATELADLGLAALPQAQWVLNTWPPALRQAYAARHRSVRFVPYNGVAHVPGWLLARSERPRICLTLGTMVPEINPGWMIDTVESLATGLAARGGELLVGVADRIAAAWPPLPSSVRHAGWLPLGQTFQSCDLSIHHGGNGTTLTSLAAGCPQLLLPRFDDQPANAMAVVEAGAGLALPPDTTPQAVTRHCLELLDSDQYRRAAVVAAGQIAAQPSPSEIVGELEELVSAVATTGTSEDAPWRSPG